VKGKIDDGWTDDMIPFGMIAWLGNRLRMGW
jgi:hypothetical protein